MRNSEMRNLNEINTVHVERQERNCKWNKT